MIDRSLFPALLLVSLTLLGSSAHAQLNCKTSVSPLAFGTYAPGDTLALDTTGQIDIACAGQSGIIQVTISPGSSGTYFSRAMQSGAFAMLYNIFIDPARTLVWGNGSGGTVISSQAKQGFGRQEFALPVYGRIPPQQSVGSGNYLDDLLITVIF